MIYDQAEPYRYIRFTGCDEQDDCLVIGGYDHKVGQEQEDGRFAELEQYFRDRFIKAGTVRVLPCLREYVAKCSRLTTDGLAKSLNLSNSSLSLA